MTSMNKMPVFTQNLQLTHITANEPWYLSQISLNIPVQCNENIDKLIMILGVLYIIQIFKIALQDYPEPIRCNILVTYKGHSTQGTTKLQQKCAFT